MKTEKRKVKLGSLSFPLMWLLALLGVTLRIVFLIKRGSFVFDEYYSILYTHSFSSLKKLISLENNPPFYYLLVFIWQKLFPIRESTMRLLPLVFSLLQLPVSLILAKKIKNDKRFIASVVILTALSPLLIQLSSFGRMYSLLALFSTVFFIFLISKTSFYNSAGLIISGILLSLTHIFGNFLVVSGFLAKFLLSKTKRGKKNLILTCLLILVPILIWMVIQLPMRSVSDINESWYINLKVGTEMIIDKILSPFLWGIDFGPISLVVFLLGVFIILSCFWPSKIKFEKKEKESLFILLSGIIGTSVLGMLTNLSTDYYYIGTVPLVIIVFCFLIWKNESNYKIGVAPASLMVCCLASISAYVSIISVNPKIKGCWDKAAQYITENEKSGEQVLVAPFFLKIMVDYYYQGGNKVGGLTPPGINQNEENIITNNWKTQLYQDNVSSIVERIQRKNGFLLIQTHFTKPQELILPEMLKQGFTIDEAQYFDCKPIIWVYHFRI